MPGVAKSTIGSGLLPKVPFQEVSIERTDVAELEKVLTDKCGFDFLVHPVGKELVIEMGLLNHACSKVDRFFVLHAAPVGFQ